MPSLNRILSLYGASGIMIAIAKPVCLGLLLLLLIQERSRQPLLPFSSSDFGLSADNLAQAIIAGMTLSFLWGITLIGRDLFRHLFGHMHIPHMRQIFPEGLKSHHRQVGWVYVLSNPAMPGIFKVGYTSGDPNRRARELDTTGVPTRFRIEWCLKTAYAKKIESQAHRLLARHRVRNRREFFSAPLSRIVWTIFSAQHQIRRVANRIRNTRN